MSEQRGPGPEDIGEPLEPVVHVPGADGWVDRQFSFPDHAQLAPAEAERRIRDGFREVDRLAPYGIAVPEYHYTLEQDSIGRPSARMRVVEVTGIPLEELAGMSGGSAHIESLLVNLSRYFSEAFEDERDFLDDIAKPEQYVFGKTTEDAGNKVYLLDIEPNLTDMHAGGQYSDMSEVVSDLHHFIVVMEDIADATYTTARRAVSQLIHDAAAAGRITAAEAHNLTDQFNR